MLTRKKVKEKGKMAYRRIASHSFFGTARDDRRARFAKIDACSGCLALIEVPIMSDEGHKTMKNTFEHLRSY